MIVLSGISYFLSYCGVHAFSWFIAAWQVKLARYCIFGAVAFVSIIGVKAYWQWGMISRAGIEAATARAKEQAQLDAAEIQKQRDASIEADARATSEREAQLEEARRASQPNSDPVVLLSGDSWLLAKTERGAGRH